MWLQKSLTSKILNDMFSPLAIPYLAEIIGNIDYCQCVRSLFNLKINRWGPDKSTNHPKNMNPAF